MLKENSVRYNILYDSNLERSIDNENEIFNVNIESINNTYNYHYFCNKCHKFPFIKLCKDRKNVRFTCSCFNNKKISIEELFKINSIEDSISIFLSQTNLNINNFKGKLENTLKVYLLKMNLYVTNIIKSLKSFQHFF